MSTIFSKIIKGEIPSYKIYEDDKTYAFLDIHPESKGHTLVVPKNEVDVIYDLPKEDWDGLWESVRVVSKHMEEVLGRRIVMKVVGTDVPHAHVHQMPLDSKWEYGKTLELKDEEFVEIRNKLAFQVRIIYQYVTKIRLLGRIFIALLCLIVFDLNIFQFFAHVFEELIFLGELGARFVDEGLWGFLDVALVIEAF